METSSFIFLWVFRLVVFHEFDERFVIGYTENGLEFELCQIVYVGLPFFHSYLQGFRELFVGYIALFNYTFHLRLHEGLVLLECIHVLQLLFNVVNFLETFIKQVGMLSSKLVEQFLARLICPKVLFKFFEDFLGQQLLFSSLFFFSHLLCKFIN